MKNKPTKNEATTNVMQETIVLIGSLRFGIYTGM
ncbi:hypothetical protein J3E07_001663 [Methanococcus voltae]|uniref:Uncharacterized protein n=1 Tax=Methanococcus voltae TaxID=2188 RepID=A0A8J7RI07_METVO|nr:hypothetical protein [Methanococcus voltae]